MDTKEKKLTSIRINKSLYNYLQKKAKEEHRSLNNYIEFLLYEATDYKVPNPETLAAMQEALDDMNGKIKLVRMKEGESVREFFDRMLNE